MRGVRREKGKRSTVYRSRRVKMIGTNGKILPIVNVVVVISHSHLRRIPYEGISKELLLSPS